MPEFTDEERTVFLREHRDLQYASIQMVEREMEIADAARSLALAERYMTWLLIINDPEASTELRSIAAEMVYLYGFLDGKAGEDLP